MSPRAAPGTNSLTEGSEDGLAPRVEQIGVQSVEIAGLTEGSEDGLAPRVEQIGVQSVEIAGHLLKTLATIGWSADAQCGCLRRRGCPPRRPIATWSVLSGVGFIEQSASDGSL